MSLKGKCVNMGDNSSSRLQRYYILDIIAVLQCVSFLGVSK